MRENEVNSPFKGSIKETIISVKLTDRNSCVKLSNFIYSVTSEKQDHKCLLKRGRVFASASVFIVST